MQTDNEVKDPEVGYDPHLEIKELKEQLAELKKLQTETLEKIGNPPKEVPNPEPIKLEPVLTKEEVIDKIYEETLEKQRLLKKPHLTYGEFLISQLKNNGVPNVGIIEVIEKNILDLPNA